MLHATAVTYYTVSPMIRLCDGTSQQLPTRRCVSCVCVCACVLCVGNGGSTKTGVISEKYSPDNRTDIQQILRSEFAET